MSMRVEEWRVTRQVILTPGGKGWKRKSVVEVVVGAAGGVGGSVGVGVLLDGGGGADGAAAGSGVMEESEEVRDTEEGRKDDAGRAGALPVVAVPALLSRDGKEGAAGGNLRIETPGRYEADNL